jgi:hypothetical protein
MNIVVIGEGVPPLTAFLPRQGRMADDSWQGVFLSREVELPTQVFRWHIAHEQDRRADGI